MKKYPTIGQALRNLEKASEERNIKRNIGQDHAEWLELVYFNTIEIPIIYHSMNYLKTRITLHRWDQFQFDERYFEDIQGYDTSPFVYLNKN